MLQHPGEGHHFDQCARPFAMVTGLERNILVHVGERPAILRHVKFTRNGLDRRNDAPVRDPVGTDLRFDHVEAGDTEIDHILLKPSDIAD